jgi:hypothetical protein
LGHFFYFFKRHGSRSRSRSRRRIRRSFFALRGLRFGSHRPFSHNFCHRDFFGRQRANVLRDALALLFKREKPSQVKGSTGGGSLRGRCLRWVTLGFTGARFLGLRFGSHRPNGSHGRGGFVLRVVHVTRARPGARQKRGDERSVACLSGRGKRRSGRVLQGGS